MYSIHLDDMLDLANQHQAEIRATFERDALASFGRADRRSWRLPNLKGLWSAIAVQLSDNMPRLQLRGYRYRG